MWISARVFQASSLLSFFITSRQQSSSLSCASEKRGFVSTHTCVCLHACFRVYMCSPIEKVDRGKERWIPVYTLDGSCRNDALLGHAESDCTEQKWGAGCRVLEICLDHLKHIHNMSMHKCGVM